MKENSCRELYGMASINCWLNNKTDEMKFEKNGSLLKSVGRN